MDKPPKNMKKKSSKRQRKKIIKKVSRREGKIRKTAVQGRQKRKRRSGKPRRPKRFPLTLIKPAENPIIAPILEQEWEAWQTFNPGIILLDDKVYILYRALGPDGLSRLGYAVSSDGLKIDERLPFPVYEHKLKP